MSTDGTVHIEDVESVLRSESTFATVSEKAEDSNIKIDLNQTLERIDHDIVCKVLEQENGNKTNAAKRLDISRSTLWRLLRRTD